MDSQPDDKYYSDFFPDIPVENDFAQSDWAATTDHHNSSHTQSDFAAEWAILMQSDDVAVSGQLMASTDQAVTQCDWALTIQPDTNSDDQVIMQSDDVAVSGQLMASTDQVATDCEWALMSQPHKSPEELCKDKFVDTVQFHNLGFFPEIYTWQINSLEGVSASMMRFVSKGKYRTCITQYLSRDVPTPLSWFFNLDPSLFQGLKMMSGTQNMQNVVQRILSNCPNYQNAIELGHYKPSLSVTTEATAKSCPQRWLHDSSTNITDYIILGTTIVSKAKKNKVQFLEILQFKNSQYFIDCNQNLIRDFFGVHQSLVSNILTGKRHKIITERLSQIQPTPIEWFSKLDDVLFEGFEDRLNTTVKKPIIDHIFSQCSAYQTALHEGNYMYTPLPPNAPAGTSYLEMYMPGLKGLIEQDLTARTCVKNPRIYRCTASTTTLQVPFDHTMETQDGGELSENDDIEMKLLESTQRFSDGGNEVTSAAGSAKCKRTLTREQHDPIEPLKETTPEKKKARVQKLLTVHSDRAIEKRIIFVNTVQLYNSIHFDLALKNDIEPSFPDTKYRAISAIRLGKRRYEITKFLSKCQPTPVDWFTSVPDIFFEQLIKTKLDGASAIFEQSPAYQEAIRGDDYMHKPLPRIKPEGFSYWKTYMPTLKGVEGDLIPK